MRCFTPPSPGIASPRGYCQAPHPPGADSPSWNAHPGPDRSPAEVALGREYHSHPGTEKLGESGSFWPAKHIKTWEFSVPLFQTKPNHTGSLGHTGSSAWYRIESLEEGDACLGLNSDPITRFIQRFSKLKHTRCRLTLGCPWKLCPRNWCPWSLPCSFQHNSTPVTRKSS